MWSWFRALFQSPVPAGSLEVIRVFTTADPTITADDIVIDRDAWLVDAHGARTVRLFEVPDPGAEQCLIAYRVK